jgi:hypothetical protein
LQRIVHATVTLVDPAITCRRAWDDGDGGDDDEMMRMMMMMMTRMMIMMTTMMMIMMTTIEAAHEKRDVKDTDNFLVTVGRRNP